MPAVRFFDLFCGAGGSSAGAVMAGAVPAGALDCWSLAAETWKRNFPDACVWKQKAELVRPGEIREELGPVDLLLASPECTSHSVARGCRPASERSRETAFEVVRFARVLRPRWIVVENVLQMRRWHRFEEWLHKLQRLGYYTAVGVLDAVDFGVPQTRRRLFVVCDLDRQPFLPAPTTRSPQMAASIIGYGEPEPGAWKFKPVDAPGRAGPTLERYRRAVRKLGRNSEFLLVYYGSDGAGGFQDLERPLRTVTTLDRFAYVRRNGKGHEMRMLQPPELARAMGFPDWFQWVPGTRRDRIRLIGNAVCPPVMCAAVRALTGRNR